MPTRKKRKVGAIAGAVAVVGAAVALTAGTYSYFSDQGRSPYQKVTSGTLTLQLGGSARWTPLAANNVEPGWQSALQSITFVNSGSLPGIVRFAVVPNPGNDPACGQWVRLSAPGYINEMPLADAARATSGGMQLQGGALAGGGSRTIGYTVDVAPDAGNRLQGKTCSALIEADLVQSGHTGSDHLPPFQATPAHG